MFLHDWKGVPSPAATTLDGCVVRLEPLDAQRHALDLYQATAGTDTDERFKYLVEEPPSGPDDVRQWAERVAAQRDPMFFAVIDKRTGQAVGRQALMRIDPTNGVVEVGHILWGSSLARTRGATEALFLFGEYVFGLGYRRFEWKCDDRNPAVKACRSALRIPV